MQHYRLYFLVDDHITKAEVIEAGSDDEALDKAGRFKGAYAMELWLGAKRVGQFEIEG